MSVHSNALLNNRAVQAINALFYVCSQQGDNYQTTLNRPIHSINQCFTLQFMSVYSKVIIVKQHLTDQFIQSINVLLYSLGLFTAR